MSDDKRGIVAIGFINASDEQADMINQVMQTGEYDCVTFIRFGETQEWVGWAATREDNSAMLYFQMDPETPPIMQAALDSLMIVLDENTDPDNPKAVQVTAIVEQVRGDDG